MIFGGLRLLNLHLLPSDSIGIAKIHFSSFCSLDTLVDILIGFQIKENRFYTRTRLFYESEERYFRIKAGKFSMALGEVG